MSNATPAGLPGGAAPGGASALPSGGSSALADGDWHRLHPLTPLFKGGLLLVVVLGIVTANLRDRLIGWVVRFFAPGSGSGSSAPGDPLDWVLANNFVLLALLAIFVVLVLLVLTFWLVWRFQQFRITGEHVEVRKGIVFRSHRRAPLDRVQGVNLTRPFPARLIGMAKLEVVGAGTDANVPLEYLSTTTAEKVRDDILRLASGARQSRERRIAARTGGAGATGFTGAPGVEGMPQDPAAPTRRSQLVGSVNEGVTGLIAGVDLDDVPQESVLRIPAGRLIASQALAGLVWLVFFGLVFAIVMIFVAPAILAEEGPGGALALLGVALVTGIPLLLATIAVVWAQIARSLRYSIAPTADGVRITFGLLTTVTETIPPGRIFAVEVSQSPLWRPFGWWTIRINRMTGKSASQQQSGAAQQFTVVLPVGKRADVERVLSLILPDVPAEAVPMVWEHGVLGPVPGDRYQTMARRAWWRRPFSFRRHGIAVEDFAVFLRRGRFWRKLAMFPLARMQGFSLHQGPVGRAQRVAIARVHTVTGPVTGGVTGIDRDWLLATVDEISVKVARASAADRGHRWAADARSPFPGYRSEESGGGAQYATSAEMPPPGTAPRPGTVPQDETAPQDETESRA